MEYFKISDQDFWQKIDDAYQKSGGIYKLRCIEKDGYLSVNRLGGGDEEGILYIGCAAVLSYRLASVRKAVCAAFSIDGYIDSNAHPVGAHFYRFPFLKVRLPYNRLCVTLEPAEVTKDNPDAHFRAENDALAAYCSQFGELPPFNLKLGGINLQTSSVENDIASS